MPEITDLELHEANQAYANTTFCPLSGQRCNIGCPALHIAYRWGERDDRMSLPYCESPMLNPAALADAIAEATRN